MNLLETWVNTPAASALGWTLVHSLWEGAIVALLARASRSGSCGLRARVTPPLAWRCSPCWPPSASPSRAAGQPAIQARRDREAASPRARPRRSRYRHGGSRPCAAPPPTCRGSRPSGSPECSSSICAASPLDGRATPAPDRRLLSARPVAGAASTASRARLQLSRPVTLFESCLADVPAGHRLSSAGDPDAGRPDRGTERRSGGSHPAARAGAHPPPRLSGQPAAGLRRRSGVLSPRRLVDLRRHPRRARKLL